MGLKRTRVLIVDDAAVVRALLTEVLTSDSEIEVVGAACNPLEARELIKLHRPDVLTLDIEMPEMDGLTFLRKLMRMQPMPVVMISSLTERGAAATLEALEIGAVDFVPKSLAPGQCLSDRSQEIIAKVKTAAQVRRASLDPRASADRQAREVLRLRDRIDAIPVDEFPRDAVIAIGASTGGTEAIREILEVLPDNIPPVVVVQHIPAGFGASLASRLDGASRLDVREAADGDVLGPGRVFLAPGDQHLRVVRREDDLVCRLSDDAPVNNQRPSIDVLFDSVRLATGNAAVGVLLTGMGSDGSEALLGFKDAGASTLAQDEETSVVWGIPKAALAKGAVDEVKPIDEMATAIITALRARNRQPSG